MATSCSGRWPMRLSEAATGELARLLDGIEGPALVVLAGDTFDLAGAPNHCPAKALTSHPVLVRAIDHFLSLPDHRTSCWPASASRHRRGHPSCGPNWSG